MLALSVRTIAPDVTVLEADGRITLGRNAQELEWKIDELLKQQPLRLVLDLSKVNYLDSTGIGIIVMCNGKLKNAGGGLRLAGTRPQIERIFKLTSLDKIVQFYSNPSVAAADFN